MIPAHTVAIVIPAYNEAGRLATLLTTLSTLPYHCIIVDDGSTDHTAAVVTPHTHCTLIRHPINRGVGAATQTGLEAAKLLGYTTVVTMDGDGQHHPEDIPKLLTALETHQVDVVIGSRFLQANTIPSLRRAYNHIGNFFTFLLSGIWVTDSQSGFKAFGPKALDALYIHANGYEFCTELIRELRWYQLRYKEVPIQVTYFTEHRPKGQGFAQGVRTLIKLCLRSLMR